MVPCRCVYDEKRKELKGRRKKLNQIFPRAKDEDDDDDDDNDNKDGIFIYVKDVKLPSGLISEGLDSLEI